MWILPPKKENKWHDPPLLSTLQQLPKCLRVKNQVLTRTHKPPSPPPFDLVPPYLCFPGTPLPLTPLQPHRPSYSPAPPSDSPRSICSSCFLWLRCSSYSLATVLTSSTLLFQSPPLLEQGVLPCRGSHLSLEGSNGRFIGTDWKIPNWPVKTTFLGEVETD